jgi:hypothetical protein
LDDAWSLIMPRSSYQSALRYDWMMLSFRDHLTAYGRMMLDNARSSYGLWPDDA